MNHSISFLQGLFIVLLFSTSTMAQKSTFKAIAILSRAEDHRKMMDASKAFLEGIAAANNFTIDITDDTSVLNDDNLSRYTVLVQLQEAAFDMSAIQQAAVQKFIEHGNGWVGIHAAGLTGKQFIAADKVYWQWFEDFMGGIIYSPHPAFQQGTVIVEDRNHPITKNLPAKFSVPDEWYEFNKSPRPNVHVLAVADEASYKQNKSMGDHPIIWTNPKFRRMIYIGIGHDASLCKDPNFTTLVRDAILWANSK
ncbi:MAG TPA: ThuA domain-containing protein [Chryseolinea sp.]|nr:ThuA domain-containing protein [Chryseolinea sp.]